MTARVHIYVGHGRSSLTLAKGRRHRIGDGDKAARSGEAGAVRGTLWSRLRSAAVAADRRTRGME